MERKRIALSWSGGKDSCFALHKLTEQGFDIACLVTTAPKETGLTFAHGEKIELIQAQGKSLGIPVHIISCTFDNYTEAFQDELFRIKEIYQLEGIAFGDLYLEEHREWGEQLARVTNLEALYPIWIKQSDSMDALATFIDTGYKAIVIRVMHGKLPDTWLGKNLNQEFLRDIQKLKICPMGESGEYHTYVYDGPLFREKIEFQLGSIIHQEYSNRLEISLEN